MPFQLDILAQLCRQMRYTPRRRRLEQLRAAEELLLRILPDQAYPPAFVIQGITGYRPKEADLRCSAGGSRLAGIALQHDLGLLCETVSDETRLPADDPSLAGEPVVDLDAACDRFGVTSKTLQRWRRRGLPARRLVFADGKQRVAFRLSCIERFVAGSDAGPAVKGQLDAADVDHLVRVACRLAAAGHDRREVVLRTAKTLKMSAVAARTGLDAGDPALLATCPVPPDAEACKLLARDADRTGVFRTARSMRRPAAVVYRAVLADRAARVASATVKFHDDPLFHPAGLESHAEVEGRLDHMWSGAFDQVTAERADAEVAPPTRPPAGLAPYLADLYRTPLLPPTRERALFQRYNYHKFRFADLRSHLDPHLCRRRAIEAMERHLGLAREARNRLVTANLRLVVHVARKHLRPDLDLMDLVSEGNITLMRAVEGFDVSKGFKFSTYATLALMKGFARGVPELRADRRAAGGDRTTVEGSYIDPAADALVERDELDNLLRQLDSRERLIVSHRFGLDGEAPDAAHLAERLGISGRRLRQIEAEALDKLRLAFDILANKSL